MPSRTSCGRLGPHGEAGDGARPRRAGRSFHAGGHGLARCRRYRGPMRCTRTGLESDQAWPMRGQNIGKARAGDGEAHAGLAGGAGIAVGHEARTLFVADQHMLDAWSAAGRGTSRHCGRRECRRSYRRHRLRAGRPGLRRLIVRRVGHRWLRVGSGRSSGGLWIVHGVACHKAAHGSQGAPDCRCGSARRPMGSAD